MKRKHSYGWPGFYNPFSLYGELFRSTMQIGELLNNSGEVILRRSRMMEEAANSGTSVHYNEFITMWQEKIAAYSEACFAMARHAGKMTVRPQALSLNEKNIKTHLRGLQAIIKPYHSKSKANALRLRKK